MATLGELKVKITGDTTSLDRALGSTRSKLESMEQGLTSLGQTLTASVTAPLVGMAGAAVASFNSFDSAIAGVGKTVDASQEDFRALVGELEAMTTRLPASIEEIGGVAEAAGQLGVKTEDIAKFTETMINLGETTNLSADQAATELARFSNVMGTSADDVERLGSTIVDLGNNFETTEAEIVNMGARLAGAGRQIGLTESDVLAFSTALTSVGINAEAGGTAFSRVMIEMEKAVEKGGPKLETFAKTAGMSADQFATAFREDAAGALVGFVEGLGDLETQGGSTTDVFEDLEFNSVRVQDALRRSASAGDKMRNALERGESAWTENVALAEEAAQRYATFDAQLGILKNRFIGVARDVGAILMPQFMALATAGTELVERFSSLSSEQQSLGIAAAGVAAAIGPALIALGKFSGALNIAIGVVAPVVSALSGFVTTIGSVVAAATGMGSALGALVGGTGALVVFAGFARAIARNWDDLRWFFSDLKDAIVEAVRVTVETVRRIWENNREIIVGTVASITDNIATIFEGLADVLATAVRGVRDAVMWIWEEWGEAIKDVVENAIRFVVGVFGGVGDILAGIIQTISGLISGDWADVWDGMKTTAEGAFDTMKSVVLGVVNAMLIALKKAFDWAPWLGEKIGAAQQAVEDFITEDQKKRLKDDVDEMASDVSSGYASMENAAYEVRDNTTGAFDTLLANVNKTLSPAEPTAIAGKAKATADKVEEEFGRMERDAIEPLGESFGSLKEASDEWVASLEPMGAEIIEVEGTKDGLVSTNEDLNEKIEAGSVAMEEDWAAAAERARIKAEEFQAEVDALATEIEEDLTNAMESSIESIIRGDGFGNAIDGLKTSFINMATEGISKTVVSLMKGETSLTSALGKSFDKIKGVGRALTGEGGLLNVFSRVGTGIGQFVNKLIGGGDSTLVGSLGKVASKLGSVGSSFTSFVATGGPLAAFAAASLKIFSDWEGSIGDTLDKVGEGVKKIVPEIIKDIGGLFTGGDGPRSTNPNDTKASEFELWRQAFGGQGEAMLKAAKQMRFDSVNALHGWLMSQGAGTNAATALAGYYRSQGGPPTLAEGGLAFGPTLAQIGDNLNAQVDPEVVAPLSDLQSILMNTMNAGGGGATHQTIVVNLDGRTIAEATAKNLPEYLELVNLR